VSKSISVVVSVSAMVVAGAVAAQGMLVDAAADMRRGEGPAPRQDDLTTYSRLARREDPFGILQARSLRTKASQL
jgi:hypothetical protein